MLPELADKVTLFALLHSIDVDLAERCRADGCRRCDGPLHRAAWVRKPRGGPELPAPYCVRFGLCCGNCRRRCLPPSTLFFGRRVYWGVVVVVVMALRHSARPSSMAELRRLFGVSPQTIRRWRTWFAEVFPSSPRWKRVRGRLRGHLDVQRLPTSVWERFGASADAATALAASLRLLATGEW